MRTANFTPLNDVRNHLVYCENGSSVETVIVNGEIMVEHGRLTRVDEEALMDELRDMMPAIQADQERLEAKNRGVHSAARRGLAPLRRDRHRYQPLGQRQSAALADQPVEAPGHRSRIGKGRQP